MHVAITGASSGIGAALAREFGTREHVVTLVARRRALLEELAGALESGTHVAVADLGDTTHCCDWIAAAELALGPGRLTNSPDGHRCGAISSLGR